MKVQETKLKDVWLVTPDKVFEDFRGQYWMNLHKGDYQKRFGFEIVETDLATSAKGVLRGIHYSPDDWKIYECVHGKLFYAIVNCDEKDPEFGKSQCFVITDQNHIQIVKHPRYGAGMLALTEGAILYYMQSEYYVDGNPNQRTFKWDDPRFNIFWPEILGTPWPILSERDVQGAYEWEKK